MAFESVLDVTVDVASDGGPLTASPTWVDRSADVLAGSTIRLTRGRQSEQADASPGSCSFTLRGTTDDATGLIGRRVRVVADVKAGTGYDATLGYDSETYFGADYPMWSGHITDVDEEWDGSGTRLLNVRAVGILEVLGRYEMPGVFYDAMKDSAPDLWWPLDDPAGSTQAREVVSGSHATITQAGTGGTLAFGAGPVFDDTVWLAPTRSSASNGKYLAGLLSGVLSCDQDFTLACVAATTPTDGVAFGITGTPTIADAVLSPGGGQYGTATVTNPGAYNDGWPHLCVMSYTSATDTVEVWVDGVTLGAVSGTGRLGSAWGQFREADIGGYQGGNCLSGNVAHAAAWQRVLTVGERQALWDAAKVSLAQAQDGFTRFSVLADAAGVPTGLRATEGESFVSLLAQSVRGSSPVDAMSQVADDELGVLTESASGRVALVGRGVRASHVPTLTLDARYDVLNEFRLRVNTSGLTNEATITRDGGNTFTVVNDRSVTEHGRRSVQGTSYADDDTDAEERAGWLANQNALPSPRSDQIVVDMEVMGRRSLLAAVLSLEPSARLEVTTLPDGGTLLFDVEGFDDEIGVGSWKRTIRVSPHFSGARPDEGYALDATGTRAALVDGGGSEAHRLLTSAVLWLDAATGDPPSNLGSGGSALDATNTGATWLGHDGTNYVYLPGVNGNYLSTPDTAALDITGDLDLRAWVALDDWTPSAEAYPLSKWSSGQQSYALAVTTTGALRLYWTTDGSTNIYRTSTVTLFDAATGVPGLRNGDPLWIRATLDVNNGASGHDVEFYWSVPGPDPKWSLLGSKVTTAGTTSTWSGSAPVEVGTISTGSSAAGCAGKVFRAQVYSGIGGTLVLDVDPSVIASGSAASFQSVDSSPKTVTINRTTSGRKTAAVVASCFLLGADDYLRVPDSTPLLDFSATDPFTVMAVYRQPSVTPSQPILTKKSTEFTGSPGWTLRNAASGTSASLVISDGTQINDDQAFTAGATTVTFGVRDTLADTLTAVVNDTATASTTDTTTGSLGNGASLTVGAYGASTVYLDAEFMAVAVWRTVLTAAERAAVTAHYLARWA